MCAWALFMAEIAPESNTAPTTMSTSSPAPSTSTSNGASGSLLPRWRLLLSMLNWRRDPGLEKKIEDAKRRSLEAEKRTMQLRSETEQIVKETEPPPFSRTVFRELLLY